MTEPTLEDPADDEAAEQSHEPHAPLRASFVAVLAMTAVFVAAWGAVFAIAMGRR